MVNRPGNNQWRNGEGEHLHTSPHLGADHLPTEPPEDALAAALLQYAKDRLPLKQRLDRLASTFGYHIR